MPRLRLIDLVVLAGQVGLVHLLQLRVLARLATKASVQAREDVVVLLASVLAAVREKRDCTR